VNRLVTHADTPSRSDCLRFERYTRPLVDLIEHDGEIPPFTVGLFGPWGSGKSTVLRLVGDQVRSRNKRRCLIIEFNPWIHRKEPNLLIPLLHTIHDALASEDGTAVRKSARKLWTCLVRLGAGAALQFATAGAVNLKQIEELEEKYLKETATARSELRQLRTTLQGIAHELAERGTRLVLFIDDLDRCEPTEIVDVLEGIKLFLDVDNILCVIAVDRSILDVGIEARYLKAGFPPEAVAGLGARYLDKIVQLPLYVLPLSDRDVDNLIETLGLNARAAAGLASVRGALVPNPRHIKRIANMLASTLLTTGDNGGFVDELVAKLAVLRVQFPSIFEAAIARPEFLHALAAVYRRDIDMNRDEHFALYHPHKEHVQAMCKLHYRVNGLLETLFHDRQPLPSVVELQRHLLLAA
jgi:KAP family P-loop domain